MTAPDERRRVGYEVTLGVMLILFGIAVGLGGFAAIAAGCGYSQACGKGFPATTWLIPVAVAALPFVGGVAVLWAASRDLDAQGTSTYPVQQPSTDATQPGPEQPSDG